MGDAAHATSPSQASSGGMSLEDAYILTTLLGAVTSSDDVSLAFQAYDDVRRPRTQRIVQSSEFTMGVMCDRKERSAVEENLLGNWREIVDWRAEEEGTRALQRFAELKADQ